MKDLRHPAKPLYRSETKSDETLVSEMDSEEEDYHKARNSWQFFDIFSCAGENTRDPTLQAQMFFFLGVFVHLFSSIMSI